MDLVHLATILLTPSALLGFSFCVLVFAYLRSHAAWYARSRGLPLPPGPSPLPLVGNMFDWPKSYQWAAFRDMKVKYGEWSISLKRALQVVLMACTGVY